MDEYRGKFHKEFNVKLKLSKIDRSLIGEAFEVAVSTILRWEEGTCAPHPILGDLIIKFLDDIIANKGK